MATRIDAELLIPGRGEPVTDGTVIVEGATISWVGPSARAPGVDGDRVHVPVAMPGLWEAHAHFVGIDTPDITVQVTEPVARQAARADISHPRQLQMVVKSALEGPPYDLDIPMI